MSLREKLIFFGIIIAIFCIVLFGFIFPAEEILKSEKSSFLKLKSPTVACSTLENFNNMVRFSENKDYVSAEKYLDTKKCERLESGVELEVVDADQPGTLVVKPKDRSIHLFISSATTGN